MLRFHILNRYTGQTVGVWATVRNGARSINAKGANIPLMRHEAHTFGEMLALGLTMSHSVSQSYIIETLPGASAN